MTSDHGYTKAQGRGRRHLRADVPDGAARSHACWRSPYAQGGLRSVARGQEMTHDRWRCKVSAPPHQRWGALAVRALTPPKVWRNAQARTGSADVARQHATPAAPKLLAAGG